MQNDILKNNIAPWQEKGRWYHGTWDLSTESFIADKTDDLLNQCTISKLSSGDYLTTPAGYIAINCVTVENEDVRVSTSSNVSYGKRYLDNEKPRLMIAPRTAGTGTIEIYVFMNK